MENFRERKWIALDENNEKMKDENIEDLTNNNEDSKVVDETNPETVLASEYDELNDRYKRLLAELYR